MQFNLLKERLTMVLVRESAQKISDWRFCRINRADFFRINNKKSKSWNARQEEVQKRPQKAIRHRIDRGNPILNLETKGTDRFGCKPKYDQDRSQRKTGHQNLHRMPHSQDLPQEGLHRREIRSLSHMGGLRLWDVVLPKRKELGGQKKQKWTPRDSGQWRR